MQSLTKDHQQGLHVGFDVPSDNQAHGCCPPCNNRCWEERAPECACPAVGPTSSATSAPESQARHCTGAPAHLARITLPSSLPLQLLCLPHQAHHRPNRAAHALQRTLRKHLLSTNSSPSPCVCSCCRYSSSRWGGSCSSSAPLFEKLTVMRSGSRGLKSTSVTASKPARAFSQACSRAVRISKLDLRQPSLSLLASEAG